MGWGQVIILVTRNKGIPLSCNIFPRLQVDRHGVHASQLVVVIAIDDKLKSIYPTASRANEKANKTRDTRVQTIFEVSLWQLRSYTWTQIR